MSNAYNDGNDAYERGESIDTNPHDPAIVPLVWTQWRFGWLEALDATRGTCADARNKVPKAETGGD